MVDDIRSGRHRNAARYNPVAELSTIVKSAGETSVKASAVLAASGGLVAAFALPAQANATQSPSSTTSSAAASAPKAGSTAAPAALAPAVIAPEAASPVAVEEIGVVGVKAVAKPKPKPKPAPDPVAQARQSRASSTNPASRTSTRYTNPEQSKPDGLEPP